MTEPINALVDSNVALPGQNLNTFSHPYQGVGTYSNWFIFSTSHLLGSMPLANHSPGDGYAPHDITWSRWFRGQQGGFPLADPGLGPRVAGWRWHPLEYKGLTATRVLSGDYGHAPFRTTTTSYYQNYLYDGIGAQNQPLASPGHIVRLLGAAGTANTFGRTDPQDFQLHALNTNEGLVDPGQVVPTNYSSVYGHKHVQEWVGLPSAKALG